jgi:hypothetical protein
MEMNPMMLHAIGPKTTGHNVAAPFSYRVLQDSQELLQELQDVMEQQLSGTGTDMASITQYIFS